MAPRANWKGWIRIGELTAAVALYTAASTSERLSFHMINRRTGNRLHREFVDSETGKVVAPEDQVKGYEVSSARSIILEPEEIAAAVPHADKTLDVTAFVACDAIDSLYIDRPYYLAPADAAAVEAFVLIREGLKRGKVAALAEAVLFRRARTLLIRAHGRGLLASMLHFDYEVRSSEEAFDGIAARSIEGEMLDLARHIIETKMGRFDPAAYDDRYESALAALVKAKAEGKELPKAAARKPEKVIDLMEALRASARATGSGSGAGTSKAAAGKRGAKAAKTKKGAIGSDSAASGGRRKAG